MTDDLVDRIVTNALGSGQGARSLKRILAQVTERALFEMPGRVSRRGDTVVRLGLSALEDGRYEVITAPAGSGAVDWERMFNEVKDWIEDREQMMPRGMVAEDEEMLLTKTSQTEKAVRNTPPCSPSAEEDKQVPAELEASAKVAAALIASQISGEGHEVVYETELKMMGRQLGIYDMSTNLPTVRVTLWVANPENPDVPPELSGRRLRAYAEKAGIEADGWCLRRGARACEVRVRPDGRRWRRHVVIIGLDYPEARKYLH